MGKSFRRFAILVAVTLASRDVAEAALIAGWDFQSTANGGTAVAASPGTPTVFNANIGAGTLYLNGTNGSSSWLQASELSGFSGTAVNATNGLSTTTTSPSSLALLNGSSNSANGKAVVFAFDMSGLADLSLSYATQRTSTGFASHVWETSADLSTWSLWGSFASGTAAGTITTGFSTSGVLSLGPTSSLNAAPTAYVRLTVNGASGSTQNNRIDNVQFAANPVPEPSAFGLGIAAALSAAFVSRHRGNRSTR